MGCLIPKSSVTGVVINDIMPYEGYLHNQNRDGSREGSKKRLWGRNSGRTAYIVTDSERFNICQPRQGGFLTFGTVLS